jgi:hypothetical protein
MPAVNDPFLPDLAAFAALSPCSHKANLPALLKAAGAREESWAIHSFLDPTGLTALASKKAQ